MNGDAGQMTVLLIPEDGNVSSDAWQSECEGLARVIASDVSDSEITIRPTTASAAADDQERTRGLAETFSTLVVSGLLSDSAPAAFGHVWTALTAWMNRRRGCRCVLRLEDGSEFTLENLTKEEALKLLKTRTRPKRVALGGS